MSTVYVVIDDEKDPLLVCESFQDACSCVESKFGKSMTQRNKHIIKTPYAMSSSRKIDINNVHDVIDLTIVATLSAQEYILDKLETENQNE